MTEFAIRVFDYCPYCNREHVLLLYEDYRSTTYKGMEMKYKDKHLHCDVKDRHFQNSELLKESNLNIRKARIRAELEKKEKEKEILKS
ncbi:hypothetical protein [Priestia megaterium]|uniref:hypothetical protein n=1 Tax=Priestia megaterium TaxID=1404 RepID=UPI000BFCD09B|nr:hypothetical protein [Priestia megaterium]PGO60631.1 hypothetical protein CN981_08765 [Priestia megaterium]